VLKISTYILSKIESVSSWAAALVVKLLFLIKKGEDSLPNVQKSMKKVYETSNNTFYTAIKFNTKAKLKSHQSELRMEFYIDIL